MEILVAKEHGIRLPKKLLITTAKVALQKINCDDAQINICLVKDSTIKKLNKFYRGKNYATDVLSFEIPSNFPKQSKATCAGDIIISIETASKNAKNDGRTLNAELKELLVHGILHLYGYDHEKVTKAKSDKMFKMQRNIMKEV